MNQKDLINDMLEYRKKYDVFKKSINQRSDKLQSVTYDGPPFASGTPHFGHGLTSSMKDTILRYKTMKGYKVNRDRGRDCHGLPVEKYVEKKLGIDGKRDIEEKIGVKKFIEECRASVGNVSNERKTFVDQIGRRADMDNAYYTMDLDFMESVIWVFKNMYNQNLVYKGFKVQRCCPSCATALSNSEVNEGYKDKQDQAITIKFRINGSKNWKNSDLQKHVVTEDGFIDAVCAVIKKDNKYFMIHHQKENVWFFPGGKIDKGESEIDALKREIKEEIGVNVVKYKKIGTIKIIRDGYPWRLYYFETEVDGEPIIQETGKHSDMKWIEKIDFDNNDLGFALKIDSVIISDKDELQRDFVDYRLFNEGIFENKETETADVNILAWTTTPWTLPSNMFLAIGERITYIQVFDIISKEYYIVAENLLKQYYKDKKEYIQVYKFKGKELEGIKYEPLFPYINQSNIDQKYKDQFFQIITGEFVSTEDGTGIVHIAPGFGMEDFDAVANILPREDSKNRLFMPVNDFGEFTDQVDDYQGKSVFDVNKEVIARLKEEKKLIGQRSYAHSYPHCWRCETPLISKAITSRFIKEQELTKITVPNAENIGFVPETVKNRFRDTLNSAPDRNISRNRYRGSPLPVWENVKNEEDKIVIGNLDELWKNTVNGSANLTKLVFVRHGKSEYNVPIPHLADSYGKAHLIDEGKQQAKKLIEDLKFLSEDIENVIFVISPLPRAFETILPYLEKTFGKTQIQNIVKKYEEVLSLYQKLYNEGKLYDYIITSGTKNRFEIGKNIYVDFRSIEMFIPDYQDLVHDSIKLLTREDVKQGKNGESMFDMYNRCEEYLLDITNAFRTKTVVTISHAEATLMMFKKIRDFDYDKRRLELKLTNGQLKIYYRDNDHNKEVDLHKPYVDSYRFNIDGNKYHRISEVMDCRFESGSMPFGQVGYTGNTSKKPFVYPADFIIEGLDQTRGWFRAMHVVGNAIMKKNSFDNVIINGMILAEDGRKMSKHLNNYPDPKYIFERYGADSYRLYLLSSPAVRAEPMRFSERGVDQIYKDFTSAIINSYNFFETYANVDKFKSDGTNVYFICNIQKGIKSMEDKRFIENVIRISPDKIYTSSLKGSIQLANKFADTLQNYTGKTVDIEIDKSLDLGGDSVKFYKEVLKSCKGKNILIVSDDNSFKQLWSDFFNNLYNVDIKEFDIVKLPTYKIDNELDRWILAELNKVGIETEGYMDSYSLDSAAKSILSFVDKLNNRYIRRSRRRFWASGMNDDKYSAYNTLLEVMENYIKICSCFAPFLSEYIYLKLQNFKNIVIENGNSVHLQTLPIFAQQYIDKKLLDEISVVRRVISLGLFIRSKNNIKVKQPLSKLELKI
ncbi:MAG: class I tRNA ligase family protein [Candidatus Absconditicoccaceae bacterium]